MSVPKKSKTYDFHDEWEIEYLFVMVRGKCCSLTYNTSVSLSKKDKIERQCNALHTNKNDADFPPKTEIRKLKLKDFKTKLAA
jgi:hypothetical protein